jgi:hypothetical protein
MIRSRWLSFSFALAALPGSAFAQSKVCDPQAPEKCAQPIRKGEAAPFDGQLLTPALALDLGQKASHCDDRIKLEVDYAKALAAVDLQKEHALRLIEGQTADAAQEMMRKKVVEAAPKWYEQPIFVMVVSVTCTVALYTLAVKGASWLK